MRHKAMKIRSGSKRAAAACISALALATNAAMPAHAQSAPAGQPADEDVQNGRAEDIIVTAQFRSQSLQDTPLAITAISGDTLAARGQTRISDIARQAPNVSLEKGQGQRGSGLIAYIRGIGQYNSAPFYEPGVGTYIDDVYIASMHSGLFQLLDLDRVEVLRGPQGTLAGKNSVGGAIKLFSRKPTGDGSGYAEVLYGSYGRTEGRAATDFALTDNLFARVNVAAKTERGYIDRLDYGCLNPGSGFPAQVSTGQGCILGHSEGERYVAARLALRYLPTERIEINLAADYTDEDSEPAADMLAALPNPAAVPGESVAGVTVGPQFVTGGTYTSYADYCNRNAFGGTGAYCFAPKTETDVWGVQGTIDIELSDSMSLKSITAYRKFTSYQPTDSDGTPIPLSNLQIGYKGRQFSQELRLSGKVGDTVNYTLGGYLLDANFVGNQRVDIQYINNLFFNNDTTDTVSKAAYGQIQWDPVAALHLTGGIRYTKEKKDYIFYRTLPDGSGAPIPGLYGLEGLYKGSNWDYRANIAYDITEDVMAYVQYATGFKGGGTNGQPFYPDQVYPFGPEKIATWEGGAKLNLADRRVTLNIAAFYSDYSDIQLQPLTCPPPSTPFPCAGPQNVGSAHIKGFEVELFAEPVDGLRIDASLSHVDFEYYELNNVPTITSDMQAPFSPRWKWSLGAQYKIDLAEVGSLTPRIDIAYQSSLFTDPVNGPYNLIDARTLANARLAWRNAGRDLEIALEVTNLTNKYYYSNYIDNVLFTGSTYGFPGAPRRWAVSLRKDF